jgi:hypothetical protein
MQKDLYYVSEKISNPVIKGYYFYLKLKTQSR